jgi:23S rRNA (cytidine1920-2'-O)/16S rRNA (cytidine1409-2'-O)-methyltransferase
VKERLDLLLVRRGLVESREKAQRLVRTGDVLVDDVPVDKPGKPVAVDAAIRVRNQMRFVSRGGEKLEAAFVRWPETVAAEGKVGLDVGSSTGGFTDCLLRHGAKKVYAIDAGRGQLHARLLADPKVDSREETNARHLEAADFDPRPEIGVTDVSFISLKLILPAMDRVLVPGSVVVALIKPQFEAGKEFVGRGGVVRDEAVRERVCNEIRTFAAEELGWENLGLIPSPLLGPAGNREFLALFRTRGGSAAH